MKKKLSALLCALCMAMALCLTAFAAGNPTISGTAARDGSKVTLTLALDTAGAEFTSLDYQVHYDTDKLEYESFSAGDIEGVTFSAGKAANGKIPVIGDVGFGDPFTKSGTMITLTFNVKPEATGEATFTVDTVNGVNDANPNGFTVDVNKIAPIAVADSKPEVKEYPVTVNQTGKGTVTLTDKATGEVIASGSNVKENTEVVVKAEAAEGYTLDAIEVNGAKINSGDSRTITADTVINVTFTKNETPEPPATKTYKVTVDVKNATVEAKPNKDIVAGTEVEITKAVANVGYDLKSIVVTNDTTKKPVAVENNKFKMPESDVTITAKVEAHVYNIGVNNKDEHGTIEAPETAAYNSKVTVTAKPKDGYELKTVTITYIDAEGKNQTKNVGTTFTMPASNVTVTATFAKKSSGGSTTTTTPSSTNNKTTTVTATATPAPTAQPKPAAAIPQTGDTANLALYAVLFVASAMALGYVVYRKKANH